MDKTYVRMLKACIMDLIRQLFPRARAELLRLLFSDPARSLHLRDLARLSGLAVGTIQREVAHLRDAGLLLERRDGNRLYFFANMENPIFPELRGIVLKTTGLRRQLEKALQGLDGIRMAFVYGSFATGKAGPESDVDLLLIGNIGLRKIAPRLKQITETMEREVNPHVLSEESYRKKLVEGDAYITHVTKGPKLWIIGNDDDLANLAEERVASAPQNKSATDR